MSPSSLRLLPLLLAACTGGSSPSESPAGSTPIAPAKGEPTVPVPTTTPAEPSPLVMTPASEALVAEVATGFNAFGLELYREAAAGAGNQILSPASVAVALAMTQAGAQGTTSTELEQALHYDRPASEVQRALATMQQGWSAAHESTELRVANRLFGEASFSFEPAFVELTRRVFGAPLEAVDFKGGAPAARARINDWVEERTHDRIQELLPAGSVDETTRLVLTNALYFKAQWLHPFEAHATAPAPFSTPSGQVRAPTMVLTEHLRHASVPADGVELVELPYADGRFAMTVVLPTATDGLAAVEGRLDAARLQAWHAALGQGDGGRLVQVSLPKLELRPSESLALKDALGKLGITEAFTPRADFSGITRSEPGSMISEVYHKGFIAVDENGTEAAAATAVVMAEGAAAPGGLPHAFVVDHPFMFFVRDTRSGMVMFMGRVVDPTAS
ncbi:serpin family protein [Paraliomyxa miuraensis]|uniref:serpin family protein n=1 Tax=Paraliomyxa miuraensis TaxID=376150 RepID=UPI002256F75B|nr:serpin family protein [Paraliomyxa miuraensis]MCX4246448.1 serpin family protein [Paraliomyxa miuraensis]